MMDGDLRILTVVGARPQFVKAAVVSRAIRRHNERTAGRRIVERIVHTGQHFDAGMSEVFFEELDIPEPCVHLELGGGSHGEMTGRMLEGIERRFLEEKPHWGLVYGDANSTLAGALAAVKLHVPVAHVEAGLRSYNRKMPEEINRLVTDQVASCLFAPTASAVENLLREGIPRERIALVGDVMHDAVLFVRERARRRSGILARCGLQRKGYVLATVHRAENTDDRARLRGILQGLTRLAERIEVVLPLHPRTRKQLMAEGLLEEVGRRLLLIDPVGYLDMTLLESESALVATDSGGVQKEAYYHGVPCLTLRDETEWVELVEVGANTLVGADPDRIVAQAMASLGKEVAARPLFGAGNAGGTIVEHILELSRMGRMDP